MKFSQRANSEFQSVLREFKATVDEKIKINQAKSIEIDINTYRN